ncbi:MAG: glycosyltransferase family 4 protein [Lachnospiraceae bacterium]|nr:glycosyltransferase family 4 protein [Lachnospiraceae bacterium]
MRIGLDARMLCDKHITGIPRCLIEILQVWKNECFEHEFYLLTNIPIKLSFDLPENWHIVCEPWTINKGKLWTVFMLPKLISKLKLDVFWGTNYVLPKKVNGTRYVVTIYDLALIKFKDIGNFSNNLRVKVFARWACKIADKVITISKATAQDVEKYFRVKKEKIEVSYCGGLPSSYRKEHVEKHLVNPTLVFEEDYFLFISTIEPRKNVVTIVKAFEKFCDETQCETKLVLAGRIGWKSDSILQVIEQSPYLDRIIMPGYITEQDKMYLLSNAKVFVYPSLYEGFGIPILEAMEYELPIITSLISSMPEVAGDAAFYLNDVYDSDELKDIMKKTYNISCKEHINEQMRMQRMKFSWEKNAREMISIFESVVG